MRRVLISQNERNNGTDYLIVDGTLLTDENDIVKYGRIISKTDDWKENYKDDFLEIRQKKNQLLLKSFYTDKDIAGRSIYYLYMIEDIKDTQTILNYLEKDSQLIERTIDRKRTEDLIKRIESNEHLKKKIGKYALIALGISFLIYLLT